MSHYDDDQPKFEDIWESTEKRIRSELAIIRYDALGGQCYWNDVVLVLIRDQTNKAAYRFKFKGIDDLVLGEMSGYGELFEAPKGHMFCEYMHLVGYNHETDMALDAILYPLSMHKHRGLHLDGFYGHRRAPILNLNNLPEPKEPKDMRGHDRERGDRKSFFNSEGGPQVHVQAMHGGGGGSDYDPNSTVTGSSWKSN